MSKLEEVEAIALANRETLENLLTNSIPYSGVVSINNAQISNKSGLWCIGQRAGINDGNYFLGLSAVADPTSDADFTQFLIKT